MEGILDDAIHNASGMQYIFVIVFFDRFQNADSSTINSQDWIVVDYSGFVPVWCGVLGRRLESQQARQQVSGANISNETSRHKTASKGKRHRGSNESKERNSHA